jgi:hypothetical protein
MNTSKPDALMQGIALQHYQELIPETRAVYISNAAKMDAYKKAYARVLQQLQEATAIHLQQQPTPTWITLTQTGVRLQALTTLNYSMLATQMRMNQEEAMRNSTPKLHWTTNRTHASTSIPSQGGTTNSSITVLCTNTANTNIGQNRIKTIGNSFGNHGNRQTERHRRYANKAS